MNIDYKNQTKYLVKDYVAWRLAKTGYHHWHQANKIDLKANTQDKLCTAMRHLAYKFEKIYESNFSDSLDITSFNCQDTYLALIVDLFELSDINSINSDCKLNETDRFKCNWGLIVGMFSFAGSLAIQLIEKKMTNMIYTIIDLQIEFLINNWKISNWIESQGSWNSFLDYFSERYNLIKLENIDLPIENLNNTITRHNYFFKFNNNPSCSKMGSIFYLESIQNQCKMFFTKLNRFTGMAVGSIGFIALGAVYIKKRS